MKKSELILSLYELGAVKFGSFVLKSGMNSPFYIDLRVIVSCPNVLRQIAQEFWGIIEGESFNVICGVPYTALPIATAISLEHGIPMVMRRKEVKSYGTKKVIEGIFKPGERCLIIEDLITSGESILETADPLKEAGMDVQEAAVLLDREQGGCRRLSGLGIRVRSVFTITELLKVLEKNQKISSETSSQVREFILKNQVS